MHSKETKVMKRVPTLRKPVGLSMTYDPIKYAVMSGWISVTYHPLMMYQTPTKNPIFICDADN